MTTKRFFAIALIYAVAFIGWQILGNVTHLRSSNSYYALDSSVQSLWGRPIEQAAPELTVKTLDTRHRRHISPSKNNVSADLRLEYRRKGLLWFPTYKLDFQGYYEIHNNDPVAQKVRVMFNLPVENGTYDHFEFLIDGVSQTTDFDVRQGVRTILQVQPQQTRSFEIRYATRGLQSWRYLASGHTGKVNDMQVAVRTNFDNVDFPNNSLSPMENVLTEGGRNLLWRADRLLTQQSIGVIVPERLNPGPIASRITFFAPICLGFFFVVLGALTIVRKVNIHPMHYGFVAGGFFAFHLLFAYLVDLVDIHVAFFVSALMSMLLVISYQKAALGKDFPWKIAAVGQMFYLLLFSYSFFFDGVTGIIVTIGSILTLAGLMKATVKIDWNAVFVQRQQAKMARRSEKMAAKSKKWT